MPLITPEIARSMAAKAHEARRKNALAAELAEQYGVTLPKPSPQEAEYTSVRLSRTRAQLDMVDAMILEERDPQRLDRLASAQMRLSEQERILAGRPLPGSRRPGRERASAPASVEPISTSTVEPIVHKPTPAQPASADDYAI